MFLRTSSNVLAWSGLFWHCPFSLVLQAYTLSFYSSFFFFLRVFYHRFARPWMHSVERNCVSFWVPQLPCRPRHSLKIPCTPAIVKRYREECAGKSGLNVYAAQEQLSVHLLPLLADTRAVGPCAQVPAYNKLATADYNKRSQPRQISQLPEKQTYPLICFGFGRVIS